MAADIHKAYRVVSHAILYLGPDIEEKIAVSTLEVALHQLYEEKRRITRYAVYRHWCEKCPRYRDAVR